MFFESARAFSTTKLFFANAGKIFKATIGSQTSFFSQYAFSRRSFSWRKNFKNDKSRKTEFPSFCLKRNAAGRTLRKREPPFCFLSAIKWCRAEFRINRADGSRVRGSPFHGKTCRCWTAYRGNSGCKGGASFYIWK